MHVLIADDDSMVRAVFREALEEAGFFVVEAKDGQEAILRLSEKVAVVVLDLTMPGTSGMECLRHIRKNRPEIEAIMCTANTEVEHAVEAMKIGAFDYVVKPPNLDELVATVRNAWDTVRLKRENRELKAAIGTPRVGSSFIGVSEAAEKVRTLVDRVSKLDSTVLISGESGVGKGLVARLIHEQGSRRKAPFVVVSCTALPRDLVEAELFGHEKGAFTGALEKRPGRVEVAEKGTLFLDEVGDMALDLQPKLLNFLQDRCFNRIGGAKTIEVDVRVLAASNHDLRALCRDKRFREDLYFRLNVLPLHIPPLRERSEDVPDLAKHVLERLASAHRMPAKGLSEDALSMLQDYAWPGNVRELENVLERAVAFMDGDVIEVSDLPVEVQNPSGESAVTSLSLGGMSLDRISKIAIEQTLEKCKGNKSKAAQMLGISEKTIYNKMKKLGMR